MKNKTKADLEMNVDEASSNDEEESKEIQELNRKENRKKKKSGGFQSMGLSGAVFNGILRKGYKVPTPIQRKTIPIILDGKDVVAMARTGSGKTAAFLIPMLEKLKSHNPKGVRAIILSPTKELALQTYKFTKEIGKLTSLKFTTILGGERIEGQFSALHSNPDVLIATPGRLMHILTEMNTKLSHVEYVVFDEADRLFEMNFQEQLGEILSRLPDSRQTVLFSATLPQMLVDFAAAGLNSPELIRLDVDTKISDQLTMSFLECRSDDKMPVLLYLLRHVVKPSQPTFVFVATKHHVEYVNMVLTKAGYNCSILYSSLDPYARKMNVLDFKHRQTSIFIVTDLAARGIDIPYLDNVINYNFPGKAKLFLHRVGRVARAGRSGCAHSIVSMEEKPYVIDLHMFLGRTIKFAKESFEDNKDETDLYGMVPQSVIDEEEENLKEWNKNTDFMNMLKVTSNAYKHYVRTRPTASSESIRNVKGMVGMKVGYHPIFGSHVSSLESGKEQMLQQLKNYKPKSLKATSGVAQVHFSLKGSQPLINKRKLCDDEKDAGAVVDTWESSNPAKKKKINKDEEFYIENVPKDNKTEEGLLVDTGFEREASKVVMDMAGDDNDEINKRRNQMVWDRKKKKFVHQGDGKNKKLGKNESGAKINDKKKKNLYKTWLERHKRGDNDDDDDDDNDGKSNGNMQNNAGKRNNFGWKRGNRNSNFQGRDNQSEGRRSFGNGGRNFGDKKSFSDGKRNFGEGGRDFGDRRKNRGEQKGNFGDGKKSFGDGRRSFGDGRRSSGDGRKSFGDGRRSFGEGRKGFDDGNKKFGKGKPKTELKKKEQILKNRATLAKKKAFQAKRSSKKQNRRGNK